MDLPLGYSNIPVDIIKEGKPVCKLHKSIYMRLDCSFPSSIRCK